MNKKIPYNIFKKAKNAVSNDLPFDREEIRNLLDNVNPDEYSSKYHNLFKHYRRFFMTALTSTLVIVSFLVFNYFNPFHVNVENRSICNLVASSEKLVSTREIAKTNLNENFNNNFSFEDNKTVKKIENTTKVQSDSNAKNDDDDCSGGTYYIKGVVRHDTTNDWRKITYNVRDNDRFAMIKTIYFEADSGKEQAIQYYDALTFEQVLFYYKLLYNDLKSVDTPNLDLIGYAKDESEYNKLYKESDGYLNWKTKNTELREEFNKFCLISSGIHNNTSKIHELILDNKALEKLNIHYSDSSVYYYTESYYDDQAIYSLDSSIIKKYKDSPRPLLVRHLKEIFWMLNPKGKGVILNTQGKHPFDKPLYLQSLKVDSHKLSVINTDYVLPYSGWSNKEFCKTCPVFSDDGNAHVFSFSPLFYFNNLFKEFYKKNTEKSILEHVNTLKFKDKDSNNKKMIEDDLKMRELSLYTSSMRLLTNYLIPVNIRVPYFDNPITKHKINHTIWFLPNEEFLNALPDSISNSLRKELDAIKKVESGEMQPDQACKGLIPEETFFEVCKIASDNIKMVDVIPNPVTNDANLKFMLLEDRYVSISIHDQNGNFVKNVLDWEKLNNGEQNYHLDMNGLTTGTYIINITTDKSEKVVKRFIKM